MLRANSCPTPVPILHPDYAVTSGAVEAVEGIALDDLMEIVDTEGMDLSTPLTSLFTDPSFLNAVPAISQPSNPVTDILTLATAEIHED